MFKRQINLNKAKKLNRNIVLKMNGWGDFCKAYGKPKFKVRPTLNNKSTWQSNTRAYYEHELEFWRDDI